MKVFFVGDFVNDTGPGVANRMLRKGLKSDNAIVYSDGRTRIGRVLEVLLKTPEADCVCFCSPSKLNIIGIILAKIVGKKTFYIMHGYLTYENKINRPHISDKALRSINRFERYIFRNVLKVYCVSEKLRDFMETSEPDYADKFDYNYNGLDLNELERIAKSYRSEKKRNRIVALGGGMRQKNNYTVCLAIDKLNREKKLDLEFVVIGLPYTDKGKICSFDFVTYYDSLPREIVLRIMSESYLYIQNSIFETFGLAVIEALMCGCNLLISANVGATGVLRTLTEDDVILDTNDVDEIATKIERIFLEGNAQRLREGLDKDSIECSKSASLLIQKMKKCLEESSE